MSMDNTYLPPGYRSRLSIKETEIAIKQIKDFFQINLAKQLKLTRVSAPLFVLPASGLNDNLNGVERPVSFGIKQMNGERCEIVHSLAKWKRMALLRYGFSQGEGIYTDMNAIRRDEATDNLHSIYVDQWDWEAVIRREQRNLDTLKAYVDGIYSVMKNTQDYVYKKYPDLKPCLPEKITYITSEELLRRYPGLTPKQRELEAVREHKAVFLMKIGGRLSNGEKHDGRAPDYDDWNLNGDILVHFPLLDTAFEISSMGIRVDKQALIHQLAEENRQEMSDLPFHKAVLNDELPFTIGGGIGQSRLCMFFLRVAHIGEVQSSVWPRSTLDICRKNHINLL